jgi:signal transduction histidine kinase
MPRARDRTGSSERSENVLKCSVCGRRRRHAKRLQHAPLTFRICDGCLRAAQELLRKVADRRDELGLGRVPTDTTAAVSESLQAFTDQEGAASGIRFHHGVDVVECPLPICLLMFHIAREALMNAIKHAHPSDVWTDIAVGFRGDVLLTVRDNGMGFDVATPQPGRCGIQMMQERAKVAEGTLSIRSSQDDGTTLTARFPIRIR